jgi:hypothetical protein
MKDIIWLSPSLAAGAIAARLVVFFERRPQMRSRRGRGTCRGHQRGYALSASWHEARRTSPALLANASDRRRARRKA